MAIAATFTVTLAASAAQFIAAFSFIALFTRVTFTKRFCLFVCSHSFGLIAAAAFAFR